LERSAFGKTKWRQELFSDFLAYRTLSKLERGQLSGSFSGKPTSARGICENLAGSWTFRFQVAPRHFDLGAAGQPHRKPGSDAVAGATTTC
jgi:hypothetical protein